MTAICARLDGLPLAIELGAGWVKLLTADQILRRLERPLDLLTEGTREFFAEKADKAIESIKTGQAIARNLVPADLVGTIHWLVSDASQLVTGQTIAVDGGTVLL